MAERTEKQDSPIKFEHLGIGTVLKQKRLRVPPNQREYEWEESHATALFNDFTHAIKNQRAVYFLGTIVLTRGADGIPEVSDGQQRLATTTILLTAIRDWFLAYGHETKAQSVEEKYLGEIDEDTDTRVPKLTLNDDDNTYFEKRILARPGTEDRKVSPQYESNRRIDVAANVAAKHVQDILAPLRETDRADTLMQWVKFVRDGAQVIVLTVPDDLNTFTMFETLNDRGLKVSQAGLIKNYLMSRAGNKKDQLRQRWSRMLGTLDSAKESEITMTYLRHTLMVLDGPTKDVEVFEKIKGAFSNQPQALQFASTLAEGAADYVALLNPAHSKWNEYGTSTKRHIKTMLDLGVEQIRPLMFAVAKHFSVDEGKKAFRLFVSWSVRFLIVGGRGGLLDRNYAMAANQVGSGGVKTTKELAKYAVQLIPTDATFEAAFGDAWASKTHLARYYLRVLELQHKHDPEPELVPNEDEDKINLEHVLPENPQRNWSNVSQEQADAFYKRIGNMVILQATKNSRVGNASFAEKQPVLAASGFYLTKQVGNAAAWGPVEIDARQKELAKLAVKAWPIDVK